jgi:ABC-type thiamine transport system ATPase subunit
LIEPTLALAVVLSRCGRERLPAVECLAWVHFLRPAGSIELEGKDLTLTRPYERIIGTVFQNHALSLLKT